MLRTASLLLLFFLSVPALPVSGQEERVFRSKEDSLKVLLRALGENHSDSTKWVLSRQFENQLSEFLTQPGSFSYRFDSLKTLGKLLAPDNKLRLLLWNIRLANGQFHYFGFLQQMSNGNIKLTPLIDASDTITNPEHTVLSPESWYGSLYYRIIPMGDSKEGVRYTLLGWDGYSPDITQKVIEVLTINSDGKIQFGAPIFSGYLDGVHTRVIFRYSAQSSILLKASRRKIEVRGEWNQRKRSFNTSLKETEVILFDRLVPLDPALEGLRQHYVPTSDHFDGFLLQNSKWLFVNDLDPLSNP